MNDNLISKLSELEMKQNHLKRCLDVTYYNNEKRKKFFEEIKEVKKEINNVKFQIRLEREMKKNVENSNTK